MERELCLAEKSTVRSVLVPIVGLEEFDGCGSLQTQSSASSLRRLLPLWVQL